jgi:hypothetical protein
LGSTVAAIAVTGLVMVKLDPLNPRMDRHSRTRERK